ncbi:Protein of unknown function (DUF630 and DUF632 [Striga hermonthica]|uniref:Uncharacterized protein n=1 Tax=Striga hermonthica TaxID=68872 RepID=A0A9N7P5E8_STRHE|nr:Protein of unknown function (DUF630 and DUF632 [Striga hermonthica]
MGCSTSKLDDEEAVRLCKDRKKFIRQAVEHRTKFASGHMAYIQAMRRVSVALREYLNGDSPRDFFLDPFTTPPKKTGPGFISITTPDSFSVTSCKINYFRSGGNNSSVSFEERPPRSPDTYRVESYTHYGTEGLFGVQTNPMGSSFFEYSPNNGPNYYPPAPPQHSPRASSSQWEFFWNPFSSLDYYGYPTTTGLDQSMMLDDESDGIRQVREEEGIPDLEEETEHEEEIDDCANHRENCTENKFDINHVVVEDASDSSDDKTDGKDEMECGDCVQEVAPQENEIREVERAKSVGQVSKKETVVANCESKEEKPTPGFTVYVNKRPTSMMEVVKDLEDQFTAACDAAMEMSSILEASRAQYSSSSNDLSPMKMLNPVALFRSGSSRSSSSRFMVSASTSRDESYESSSSDFSEESLFSRSHQSTLDRLYAWEKKLYQEVRAGERVRIAYEKKCAQLRNQDVKGMDPSFVDKTRAAIRDLNTQIKVSIHSVEAISRRIETLRDEELEPQLLELVQGLARMWKAMAECHQLQKRTLDEAKILLAGTHSKPAGPWKEYNNTIVSPSGQQRLARSAASLEVELRNWRACFDSWIVAQRSYAQALRGWLVRCLGGNGARRPAVLEGCEGWWGVVEAGREGQVLDGMDFFAAGVGSLVHEKGNNMERRESSGMEVVGPAEAAKEEEIGMRVVCAGMSVAVSAVAEYAMGSAEGYGEVVREWKRSLQESVGGVEEK